MKPRMKNKSVNDGNNTSRSVNDKYFPCRKRIFYPPGKQKVKNSNEAVTDNTTLEADHRNFTAERTNDHPYQFKKKQQRNGMEKYFFICTPPHQQADGKKQRH